MNRAEFMRQLESLLQNISPAEREEALQYYNDYLDDAGPESEAEVLEALGNPARVAESVKRDLSGNCLPDNAFAAEEGGARRASDDKHAVVKYQENALEKTEKKKEDLPAWAIVLIVILCIVGSPAILGLGGAVAGLVIGLAATWLSIIVALAVASLTLFAVLVILCVVGVMCMHASPLVGIALIGSGLICAGVGVLFMMLTVAVVGIATPAIIKGITYLWKKLFAKKEATA